MTYQQSQKELNTRMLTIQSVLCLLVALPHATHLHLPISLVIGSIITWRLISIFQPRLRPGRIMLFFLTLIGTLIVFSQHLTLMGRDAGVSLIVLMLMLKLMESHQQRDLYVVVFISYFVIITQFLFSQSILITLYLLGLVASLTALLMENNQITPSKDYLYLIKRTLLLFVQAFPVAAILFVLFPRISHPIWQLGWGSESAYTGLSDRVSPGSISNLIQSSKVSFRVGFINQVPPKDSLYWRAMVLWDTDGFDWFNRGRGRQDNTATILEEYNRPIDYEVNLEPHQQTWLAALDLPANAASGSALTPDYLVEAKHTVGQAFTYKLRSYLSYKTQSSNQQELNQALTLPSNITKREIHLVDEWRGKSSEELEVVRHALAYFRNEPFVYTLMPPLYLDNPIDQFLFEGREGFCEHYASSFILLMRLAGIPARMVIGYLGAEHNALGDYYIVRQSDAHAWAEVYLTGKGWIRVDPTAAVAPERVIHSIQPVFDMLGSPVLFKLSEGGLIQRSLKQMGMALDAANIAWRKWIVNYSYENQLSLLRRMGIDIFKRREWGFLIVGLLAAVITALGLAVWLQGSVKIDPLNLDYRRFCHKLGKVGVEKLPYEGPQDFQKRIAEIDPGLALNTQPVTDLFIELRYGTKTDPLSEQRFHQLVRRFIARNISAR